MDLRCEQTLGSLDRVRADVRDWTTRRRGLDVLEQHKTQLASLEGTLAAALDQLRHRAVAERPASALQAYEFYRYLDSRVVLVRRLWRWFADKYDQRDDDSARLMLEAADEVIWAVHAQAHRANGAGRALPPAPLPYVDELDAPEAVPRDEPSRELELEEFDELLATTLARLPIPVVALPGLSQDAPWVWVLLGHEVGHHLMYDLAPRRELVALVGTAVESAVGGDQAQRWRTWSQEAFADLVGLVSMGPELVQSLLPYELGGPDRLLDRGRGRYPAPVVRVALLTAICRELKLDLPDRLAGLEELLDLERLSGPLDPDDADDELSRRRLAAIGKDLAAVPVVASTLVGLDLGGLGTVEDLFGFDADIYARGGRVHRRATALRDGTSTPGEGLDVVRELASAAAVAWRRVEDLPDPAERARAGEALAKGTCRLLVDSREPGTRTATDPAANRADAEAGAAAVVDLLCAREPA